LRGFVAHPLDTQEATSLTPSVSVYAGVGALLRTLPALEQAASDIVMATYAEYFSMAFCLSMILHFVES